jgi:hypothetical protein
VADRMLQVAAEDGGNGGDPAEIEEGDSRDL